MLLPALFQPFWRPAALVPGPEQHVFFVHSHITHAIAVAVVRSEALPVADCVFLYDRGYHRAAPAGVREGTVPPLTFPMRAGVGALLRNIRALDAVAREAVGAAPFHLYCPHLNMDRVRVLVTHPQCRRVSYLEEGTLSYSPTIQYRPQPLRNGLLLRTLSLGRIGNEHPFAPVHTHAFALDARCFPGLGRLTVLPNPFADIRGQVDWAFDGAHVLVLDPILEIGFVSKDVFEAGVARLLSELPAPVPGATIYYKLHPAQMRQADRRTYYADLLRRLTPDYHHLELPAALVLEEVAASFREMTFYVFVSSVGLYAGLYGHQVLEISSWMAHRDAALRRLLLEQPQIFWDVTRTLE